MFQDRAALKTAFTLFARRIQEGDRTLLTPQWASWASFLGPAVVGVRAAVKATQLLDNWVYPAWSQTEVKEPVFIVTAPRSGTTRLQRLLSMDEGRFTSFSLIQTVFPSVCVDHAIERGAAFDDAFLGRRLHRLVDEIDRRMVPEFQELHEMGLGTPEEDEAIFVLSALSPTLMMMFPFIEELRQYEVDALSPSDRRQVMKHYEGCLKRHLYAAGGDKTVLVKNVWSASRIDALLETFPDAKVIYLARHPYDAIASAISMFTVSWKHLFPLRPHDGPEFQAFGRLMVEYQKQYFELGDTLPSERFIAVGFDDLVQNPKEAVLSIYNRFGWPVSGAYEALLDREREAQRSFKSQHQYSLGQYGLSRDDVYEPLRAIFERFEFER